jgi:tetratricopeptide (TPR) repeat protein
MWHLRLRAKPSTSITTALSLLSACLGASHFASADSTSIGPVSESEARVLWKDSQAFYNEGNCQDALSRLKRLIDRYPGYPTATDYREARFELGHCYFTLNQNKAAENELKTYLEGSGDHPHSDHAKEMIGQAQLRLKQAHEAYLTSLDLEKSQSPETKIKALILRTQALMARNEDEKAQASATSALSSAEQLHSKELLGDAQALQLELKTRECAKHPSKGPLEESRVRAEIKARGTCLSEALVQFRKVLAQEDAGSSDQAVQLVRNGYADYRQACAHPPKPPKLKPKDRTTAQLKHYQLELADDLLQIYEGQQKTARQFIKTWKQETPPPSESIQRRLQSLEESLK